MSPKKRDEGMVVDQKDALSIYFDALLLEQDERRGELLPAAEPERIDPAVLTPPVISVPNVPPPVEKQVEALQQESESPTQPVPEGVPEWAEAPFQALLFKVTGLTLAVPLAELSGVQELRDGDITPMLGRIEWYLGLMEYRGRQAPVVDTAQLVLPEDRLERLLSDERDRLGHVVFIQDGQWGLACDEVMDVISLEYEAVKWRTSRSRRPWLAGTVLEHMCAIIDPPAFADMLRTGVGIDDEDDEQGPEESDS